MDIRPIRTEADYDWALVEIEGYFANEPAPGTPEADRFDVLAALLQSYENKVWPIDTPDPVSAIREWMTLHGHSQSDLATLLGSRSRASELLGGKIPLTMAMAYALNQQWRMPAELLIQPVALAKAA
jgi:HTH-type transcriptional regulator / antitoxin HigA